MKQEPKSKKPIEFQLKNIQVTNCSLRKPDQVIKKNQNFGYSFTFGAHFDKENSEIIIEISSNIFLSPKQQSVIGEITIKVHFSINNFNDFIEGENQFAFPEDFIIMLISISFSTLRGIVTEKTASTLQHSIILPIINVKEIINKQKPKSK